MSFYLNSQGPSARPNLELKMKLTGFVIFNNEVVVDTVDRYPTFFLFTPALAKAVDQGPQDFLYGLRLVDGAGGVPAVEREIITELPRGTGYTFHVTSVVAIIASSVQPLAFRKATEAPLPTLNGPAEVFVRLRAGASMAAGLASLRHIADVGTKAFEDLPTQYYNGQNVDVLSVQFPTQIENYRSSGAPPDLLAGSLALGAVVALGLSLVASVRRRRRDLALLKALGFTRAQLAWTVAWQSTIAVAIWCGSRPAGGHGPGAVAVGTVRPQYLRCARCPRTCAIADPGGRGRFRPGQCRGCDPWGLRRPNPSRAGPEGRVGPPAHHPGRAPWLALPLSDVPDTARPAHELPQPRLAFCGWQRTCQVIALSRLATEAGEAVQSGLVLDTLGRHCTAKAAGELDSRPHDRLVAFVADHLFDEGTVDLQLVERQVLQPAERREARAVVVDREADAKFLQALHSPLRALGIDRHGRLGELQGERPGLHARSVERPLNPVVHLGACEALGGQVHCDP